MSGSPDIDLQEAGRQVERAARAVDVARQQQDVQLTATPPPDLLQRALGQFFDVLSYIETEDEDQLPADKPPFAPITAANDDAIDIHDITVLLSYGFRLLDDLIGWCNALDMETTRHDLHVVVVSIALWTIRRGGRIDTPETAVNALADLANRTNETEPLQRLSAIMDEIETALPEEIKRDHDGDNTAHPWRVLMLNHGIVATRTHEPQIMEPVFERIVTLLPEDAPGFFAEGLKQLDIVGYPEPVRVMMQNFYRRTHPETLH